MFNKKILIYFSKTHLFLYYKELNHPIKLEFEPSTVYDLENVDVDWIRVKLNSLLKKTKLKNSRGVMILSKDLVFDRIVNEETQNEKDFEVKDFIDNIPLQADLIRYKEFVRDDNILITATNKKLYESLINLLKEFGIHVYSVLPEIAFSKVEFNKTFINELLKQNELLKYGNFIDDGTDKNKINFKINLNH